LNFYLNFLIIQDKDIF